MTKVLLKNTVARYQYFPFTKLNLLYPEHVFPVGSGAPSGGMWAGTIGQASENERVVKTTPYNTQGVVWETINQDTVDDGEGGSNGTYFDIDNTKTYRFSIWVRKQYEDGDEGKVYLGLHGKDAAGNLDAIIGVADGSVYANPYFLQSHNAPTIGTDIDDYHLFVGYVNPHDFVGTTSPHTDRGWWRRDGTQVLGGIYPNDGYGTEYKWTTATTQTHLRFYHYYNINPPAGETVDFFGPRVDLVDGTEPTITELIAGEDGIHPAVSPHKARSETVRVHFKVKGGTGAASTVNLRLLGRAAPDAPWYVVTECIGNWGSAVTGQVKANTDGSYALETIAMPEMAAELSAYNIGTAVKAASPSGGAIVFGVGFDHGDTFLIDDQFNSPQLFTMYDGAIGPLPGGTPVLKGTNVESCSNLRDAIDTVVEDGKLLFNTSLPATIRLGLEHQIAGTTGNSTTIVVTSVQTSWAVNALTGGTGEDTYGSVWIDDNF